MARRSRRRHGLAFKARVALAAVRGEKTLSKLAEQLDFHPNQIWSRQKQLIKGRAATCLAMGRSHPRPRRLWM